ncbi:TF29 protein, partial [Erpornis zantholeuca]|nr:TF29 protein [Erpornis zantholeuca]
LHTTARWGTQALCDHFLRTYGCIGIHEIAKVITRNCMTCQRINAKVMRRTIPGGGGLARRPFQNIQVDFTELPPLGRFRYLLVIVDHLTHWIETFPTVNATAGIVSKILLEQVIPRCGIINSVDSDQGSHFSSKVLQQTMAALNISWMLHTPWCPQSSGRVERMNRTLQELLTKLVTETKLNWLKCLLLALMRIRTRPQTDIGASPYEMLFGLPFLTTPNNLATYKEGEDRIKKYVQTIAKTLEHLRRKGYLHQSTPIDFNIHPFQLGDWVLIKTW